MQRIILVGVVIAGVIAVIINSIRHTDRLTRSYMGDNNGSQQLVGWALLVINSPKSCTLHIKTNGLRFVTQGIHFVKPVPIYKENKNIVVYVKKRGLVYSPEEFVLFGKGKKGTQKRKICDVDIELHALTPASPVDITQYFSTTWGATNTTCVHTDRRWANRQVIFLPGMSMDFRHLELLDYFRRWDLRLNVFYYESHTHARYHNKRATTVPECSFPSESFDISIRNLHHVIQEKNIEIAFAWSLGALILCLYLTRFRDTKLKKIVLLAPFLSVSGMPMQGIDTHMGSVLLKLVRHVIPTSARHNDVRVVHHGKKKDVSVSGLFAKMFPLTDETVDDTRTWISLNFINAVSLALQELNNFNVSDSIGVDTLAILPSYDKMVDSAQTEKVCKSLFGKHVVLHRPALDHYIWPCYLQTDQVVIMHHIQRFLGLQK